MIMERAMEQGEQVNREILTIAVVILREIIDSDSSSSESDDEDLEIIKDRINLRRHVPRITNYKILFTFSFFTIINIYFSCKIFYKSLLYELYESHRFICYGLCGHW